MLLVVSALLRFFSKGGANVAQDDRKNEDQEQISGENVVGKAAGEDAEFEEVDEFDEDDQDEDDEVEED
jgi:hypothetical protein